MKKRLLACAAVLLCLTGGPAAAQEFETGAYRIRVVPLLQGLNDPWAFEFLPGGDMLITERTGRLRLVRDGELMPEPVAGTPEVQYNIQGGLMDLALHPDFAENGLLYLSYSKPHGERGGTTALYRARFDGGKLVEGRDIFLAEAWMELDVNFGSRLQFGTDGLLYMSVGDRGPDGEPLAQDLSTHNGSILRLDEGGGVPEGNPFAGRPGALPEIWSYGHRNPQGITLHPETGELWASEHGPLGGDEVNIVRAGANYGWPVITYGRNYSGEIISERPWREGMEQPRFYWVPSIGISGLMFYTGERFPAWQGQLFVTGMSGMMIQRVRLQGRGPFERESLLTPLRLQFRDIKQGGDGLIYVLARGDATQSQNSGALLRIEPE